MYTEIVGQESFSDKLFSECGRQDMQDSEIVPSKKDPCRPVKKKYTTKREAQPAKTWLSL